MSDSPSTLSPIERRLHRALLEGLLATGRVPSNDELAETAEIDPSTLPDHLTRLAAADYLALDAGGDVVCLYPLSTVATPHFVELPGGARRYAMCAIDALGMAAMLEQAVAIEGMCPVCRSSIHLAVEPGTITRAEPAETVVLARHDGAEPAVETCCPFTLFACSPEHGQILAARLPETGVLSLDKALASGETIFGDLLGATLPARRRRMPRPPVDPPA